MVTAAGDGHAQKRMGEGTIVLLFLSWTGGKEKERERNEKRRERNKTESDIGEYDRLTRIGVSSLFNQKRSLWR